MPAANLNYCPDVAAVLVTHNPNLQSLRAAVQAVAGQVSQLVVIDNASANFAPDWLQELDSQFDAGLHLLPQADNLGIGAGHNIGIQWAQKHGAAFVLLLDQDSQVQADMVSRLRLAYTDLTRSKVAVAGLGPRYR
ncbi:MAG: glycosyltransferase, partial [Mariniphaga sp.]